MKKPFQISRRQLVIGTASAGLSSLCAAPALAQQRTKIKMGYVDTLAVTGQLWTGVHRGHWDQVGVEFEPIKFNTGLELFNAMIGGSLDMLSTGAVISNFPARGQGKAFLINNIEFATAQLWVREDQGVKTWADLKGKKIATTVGTTAHVFLDAALRANGIDPTKDVELVNQGMAAAVTSFISGAVPVVALWVPFNVLVKQRVPSAKMLVDASAYFPKSAIVGGWATRADYFEKNRATCAKVVQGWAAANDDLIKNSSMLLPIIQAKNYDQVPLSDLQEQFKASKYHTAAEWKKLYQDGTAINWLQQVTDFYVRSGGIQNPVPASKYFDMSIYMDVVKG
ncbi:MAG: ABC transporter substrate-binding protein [Betaproteobacteria bacterium]|nr:ABC transporter substrate-binding protein [Betaproteobacteria bacterium]NBT66847.1 ABC transporter substrate-binding protein [Betaproteobacteria bacterium]NBY08000.1 ABC transporter substrate-binding protein [Betaproteobacteria bacterium]